MAGLRFTLSHDVLGSLEISEPDGWKGAKIVLERHPEFMSLIEYYEGAANGGFIFYGSDGVYNGGIDFIKEVEQTYGFDATINITIEYSPDGLSYEQLFTGQLDLSAKNEMKDNRMQVPVIRDNFWATFINRMETPVDLSSLIDLDGNAVDPVTPIETLLTTQSIRTYYHAAVGDGGMSFSSFVNNTYYQLDFNDIVVLDELKEVYTIPSLDTTELPAPNITTEYAGNYVFDIRIVASTIVLPSLDAVSVKDPTDLVDFYIQFNDQAPIAFSFNDVTVGSGVFTVFTYNDQHTLTKNTNIRIFAQANNNSANDLIISGGDGLPAISGEYLTYVNIIADTTHPSTISEGYLVHDLIHGVLSRLGLGTNPFYSEYLGSMQTTARQYESDGCFWNMGIFKGLQIRQYSLSEKPFFISFKQIWDGINPIANLGLGYEVIDGVQVIRIEEKAHWFDVTKSIEISNVRDIGSNYDQNHIFKTIKTGYKKWQSENASGIDDPQTKHTYATRFLKTGKEINLESDFIAASLAVETTRRKVKEKTADYKFDNDNFIIALRAENTSPSLFYPEVNENFTSITGLLNSSTRYNSILTPLRNLLRWGNYLVGCLQLYTSSSLKFVSGEGNYDMVSDYDCTGGNECQAVLCGSVAENADITVSHISSYLFVPIEYPIKTPMNWTDFTTIRESLKQAIGISQTTGSHAPFFINKFEYILSEGEVTTTAWPKEYFNIQVIDVERQMPGCATEISSGGGSVIDTCYRITEDESIRITEDGNNRVTEDCDA